MDPLSGIDIQKRALAILIFVFLLQGANCFANIRKSDYSDVIESDYNYLTRSQVKTVKPLGASVHLSRTNTPKYTVFLFNVLEEPNIVRSLSIKMYVHLIRHIDHYDREFSDNVQFIVPNCYPNLKSIYSLLGRKATSALTSGVIPEDPYVSLAVSAVAFINTLVRKGIVPSLEKSSIYGNCVGGIVGSAASLAMRESLGAVVLNGSALYMPDVVRERLARKGALKNVKFLLIHSEDDARIPYVHAENTLFSLLKWGVYARMLTVVNSDHISTMVKYKYTGMRFIAAVLLRRPEILRLQDTENEELLKRTKQKMNKEEIETIVPPRTDKNHTVEFDINLPIIQRIPLYESSSDLNVEGKAQVTYIFDKTR